jgi:hypothetical protein
MERIEWRELPGRDAEELPVFHRAGGGTCIRVQTIYTAGSLPKEG